MRPRGKLNEDEKVEFASKPNLNWEKVINLTMTIPFSCGKILH